jgi:hypothetical protein
MEHPEEWEESTDSRRAAVVDLFPGVLADIADPEVAVRPVEREPPWVPKPVYGSGCR